MFNTWIEFNMNKVAARNNPEVLLGPLLFNIYVNDLFTLRSLQKSVISLMKQKPYPGGVL